LVEAFFFCVCNSISSHGSELRFELSLARECPGVETMLDGIYELLIRHIWDKTQNRMQTMEFFRRNIEEMLTPNEINEKY
jgi:hypothetical protein